MGTVAPQWVTSEIKGKRVQLRMADGDVEGIVTDLCEQTSRLTIKDVVVIDTQEKLLGQLHCYAKDIQSCTLLGTSGSKKYVLGRDENGPRLLRLRIIPARSEKQDTSVSSCEFICHRMECDTSESIKKGSIKLMGSPEDLPKLKHPIATEFEVVDKVNDQLSDAIAALKQEQSISIGYEGTKVGRHGFLSVLVAATSSKVHIFDVFALKEELFSHGLKEILESKDIQKVIHGCRHLSDSLYHQYQVSLDNVFDTMVADIILYHNASVDVGQYKFPDFVRGVQNCLKNVLEFNYAQMKYTRSRKGSQEEEVSTWKLRPLSLQQIDAVAKDVVFLRELADVCLGQMLKKFHAGVNFFLTLDRECTERELSYLPAAHILPRGFADAVKSATRHSEQQWRRYADHDRSREDRHNGRKENWHYERDSMRRGPSGMNTGRTQFREPRDAPYRGGHEWRSDLQNDQACRDDSLLFIGDQRGKENSSPRKTSAPIPNGTCNGIESKGMSPGEKEECKKPSDVPTSEQRMNDSEPTEVAVEVAKEMSGQGDQNRSTDVQREPSQRSQQLASHSQCPQPSIVSQKIAAVCGHDRDSATIEIQKKVAPASNNTWAHQKCSEVKDSTAEVLYFRPAELMVPKLSF
uniref:Putative deddy 3'-5' exonuclease domain of egalitarian n=1 Tax=Amblyomma triste TaxID=251400 RepID=A0A023GBL7_AMBTT